MLRKSWAVALLMLPLPVLAAEGLSYNYVEANFIAKEEVDVKVPGLGSGSDDGDGFNVNASFGVGEALFINGGYSDASLDDSDLDIENINVGVGAHSSQWTGAWDILGVLSYEDFEAGGVDESGFGVLAGLRGALSDALELIGTVKYTDIGDADGVGFRVGGLWKFGEGWGVNADYSTGDLEDDSGVELDIDEFRVGLRYIFG